MVTPLRSTNKKAAHDNLAADRLLETGRQSRASMEKQGKYNRFWSRSFCLLAPFSEIIRVSGILSSTPLIIH